MVKKEQLKTPPKQSGHSKRIALNQSWTVLYLTHFWCFWGFFQKRGVFQPNQCLDVTPIRMGNRPVFGVKRQGMASFWKQFFVDERATLPRIANV